MLGEIARGLPAISASNRARASRAPLIRASPVNGEGSPPDNFLQIGDGAASGQFFGRRVNMGLRLHAIEKPPERLARQGALRGLLGTLTGHEAELVVGCRAITSFC